MKRSVLAVGLALLLSGCMWGRVQMNDPSVLTRAKDIRVGETREEDLARILKAEPQMRLPGRESTLLAYSVGDTKHNGLMLVVVNFSRSTSSLETLYVEVDPQTKVVSAVHIPELREPEWRFWPFGAN